MNLRPQIESLAVRQTVVMILGSALTYRVAGRDAGLSFASGAGLMLVSVLLLAWAVERVFAQKTVAWTIAAIISKYAIFLTSIPYLTRTAWFDVAAGGLGIASFVLTALSVAVFTSKKESLRGGSTF